MTPFEEAMASALDRWDEDPFSEKATSALAEAVFLQLLSDLGPPGNRRALRTRLAHTIVDLRRGAAGDGVTISNVFRSRQDCRDALAALLVPGVGRSFAVKLRLDAGGRPQDREYIDAIAWGFTKGRHVRSRALRRQLTDAEVARWLAEEWLPDFDRQRGRPRQKYSPRSVQRAWQRIKARGREAAPTSKGTDRGSKSSKRSNGPRR